MTKRLLVTSTDLMMIQFLVPHIIYLSKNGYDIEIACSDVGGRIEEIRQKLDGYAKAIHTVRLVRSPISLTNFKGYNDLKQIIENGNYDIIWTNEPVMGVATRLAATKARKKATKVLYMVHGFHFYDGAPKLNWLIYYPIEKFMASKTDVIVTVNQEDYKRAQTMNIKRVEYIHGIGINTARLTPKENQSNIRSELKLDEDDFIILSVGELNENKNQKTIIQAISKLNDPKVHYVVCGKGNQQEKLEKTARELSVENNVHFLGYRTDVVDICSQSDVYVMPSYREGLPVSSLEAMYCGLPLVTSNIRGLVDIISNGVTGYLCNPNDVHAFANSIKKLKDDENLRKSMAEKNKGVVIPYCIENTTKEVCKLLAGL